MPKYYFGKEQEKIVKQYLKTRDSNLYTKEIHHLLVKIAYGVRASYNFQPVYLYGSPPVISGCITLMWEKLISNFNPDSDKKAYSYLTAVARNYFCHVWRTYHRSARTFVHTNLEASFIWKNAQTSDDETKLIDEERSQDRSSIAKEFLINQFKATPGQMRNALERIDALDSPNKKAVNEVLRKRFGVNTKQIHRKRQKHAPLLQNYRKKGIL